MAEPRKYVSAVRAAGAADTRRRILEAARDCFERDGYTATTLRAIAGEAGVSPETVNNHGPKRALLFAVFQQAFSEVDGPIELAEHPDLQAAMTRLGLEEFLAAALHGIAAAFARSSGIWRALVAASDVDPAVASELTVVTDSRRREFLGMLGELRARGMAMGDDPERAADVAIALVNHETYRSLVVEAGWPLEEYERWLAETLAASLAGLGR